MTKPNSKSKPPDNRSLNLLAASVELEAAPAEGEAQKLRRFTMTAYTGGAMQLAGWRYPVVVDLQGLQVGKQRRPILLDHTRDVDFVMGQTDSIAVMNDQLVVAGQVMGDSPKAKQVVALNDRGFSWQASIGARAEQVEFVPEGKTSQANGREFPGPVNIARRATLGEISFVVLGADENTSAQIAASESKESNDMDFAQWAESQGFAVDGLNEQQTKCLRMIFDAQAGKPTPASEGGDPNPAVTIRAEAAAEAKRIVAIRKVCGGKHGDIEAKAIEEGWDATRAELELLRVSRPQGPAIQAGDKPHNAAAIEAALCLSVRMPEAKVIGWYGEQAVETARSRDLRGMGLHELFYHVIHAAGGHARPGRMNDDTIRTAFESDRTLRAAGGGFSTISLSGILSNVANKALLEAYSAVESIAGRICAQTDVNDFKQVTRYRMTGQGTFEKVGPDGELKHAQLTEEAYTNQIDTYGKMIALTRQMIINDDLGAFLQIPRILGRQSALAVESAVFTLLLSNPGGFYSAANKNFLSGATSALQINSLTLAEQLFMDQTDKDGKPILISPAILLVPSALKVVAQQLMTETRINEFTGPPKPANNPHAGKWIPLASPYLNSQGLPGSSATAWYLFANPADVAAMEIAYLRGQRTPTIESGETDFDTLGMKWRGYFDFGVAMQDFRATVKSAGA
ncbi:MAG: phage major capsid protein [Microthrixaceae bacterium]